ncbi:hypothetical protein J14TS5_11000 [Paenibacillus lautus]|uniref:DUF4097 family beta strand repeat-containing protein n=1 Tax=Paenibacillus lautus TaxID=1401 RepID=UPI001B124D9C|nr:DUF4097 family beta strand repeat-containing protein [Paenibacillus lautus]GIO96014.1 hypothetical protein J14TS5_11000 [Paenibacillus lautus]
MRKIITTSLVLLTVGGLVMGCEGVGKATSYNHESSYEANRIEEIEVNNESWDIEFKRSDSPNITIACEGKRQNNKSDPVTINHDGNKIVVTQEDQGSAMAGFTFGKKGTIYISIPDREVDTITLNNNAGDIKMKNVAAQYIVIANNSGSENIEGLSADKGEFTSTDGDIKLKDSSLNELTVTTGSGASYMTDVTSPVMNITSTYGEVSVKEIEEGKLLRVETQSGDIAVSYKTPPASLKVTVSSDLSDKNVDLDGFKVKQSTEKIVEGTIGDASHTVELISRVGTIAVK